MVMKVTIPYDPVWEAMTWAKEHCSSYITNDVHCDGFNSYVPAKIDFFFSDEKDALVFSLRWV
jgi:hypothetical protein